MGRKAEPGKSSKGKARRESRGKAGLQWFGAAVACTIVVILFARSQNRKSSEQPTEIKGPVTFSKHVAPIVFRQCTPCHRDGGAPFELLTYADAKKRAKDITRVTANRVMPPWLPEHGYGEFAGERRLSDGEIALIQRWVEEGTLEGNAAETPAVPARKAEWQLGTPDLIVQTGAYTLAPDGKDIYFNFVAPIATTRTRYVAGVELLPGSPVVHHAFINVDPTSASRRLGAKSNPPGFPGMEVPESASMPGGQLLGWQPGKIPNRNSQGLAWTLRTNSDLVLQVHMNPSGKAETVQPRLGFYFTDEAPTNSAYRLRLTTLQLDIPAGESNYVAEESYTLPVDLSFVRVGAHAHYLARDMQGYAILPNGEKKWLLWIKDWNFQWQGDYQYKTPIDIPKGSKIVMRFTYDNSTNNTRNPFNPPRRTTWGLQTTDEMGELYFQTVPRNAAELQTVAMDYSRYFARVSLDYYRFRLQLDPADAVAHQRLGRALATFGKMDEAVTHLNEAIRLQPNDDKAHFDLGSIFLRAGRGRDAYQEFVTTTRLNPDDSQAFGSLGIICMQTGRLDEAREHFLAALRLNPEDALATQYLQRLNSQNR